MPTLKQVNCSIEIGQNNLLLKEYGARYNDGSVECFIAVPEAEMPFTIHMNTRGYIASGLAMFVFIDGDYQCNRNKRCPNLPGASEVLEDYEIDFRVRQKEEKTPDGRFIGRDWCFKELNVAKANEAPTLNDNQQRNVGTIEVVVLRCNYESIHLQPAQLARSVRPSSNVQYARTVSAAVPHTPSFQAPTVAKAHTTAKDASNAGMGGMSGLGGLFDGACDMNLDGAGDQRPGHDNSRPWDGGMRGRYTYPPPMYAGPYEAGPSFNGGQRIHSLTTTDLNDQYATNPPWGIDDRSAVHQHYGNARVETVPNTPEKEGEGAGAHGLDGNGYRGPPNIIINQYTNRGRPEESKEDLLLGQEGDLRNVYKARLREQGHSVSQASTQPASRHQGLRQAQRSSYDPQPDRYSRPLHTGASYWQHEATIRPHPEPAHRHSHAPNHDYPPDHHDPPGGNSRYNESMRHLEALTKQAEELQRQMWAHRQAEAGYRASPHPHTRFAQHSQQQQYDQRHGQGYPGPTAFLGYPAQPQEPQQISPEYQRYWISQLEGHFVGLLGVNRDLLMASVPYLEALRTNVVTKLDTKQWVQVKTDMERFLSAGMFPDGTKIENPEDFKYRSPPSADPKTNTSPEKARKSSHHQSGNVNAWNPVKEDEDQAQDSQENKDKFWAPSVKSEDKSGGLGKKNNSWPQEANQWDNQSQSKPIEATGEWNAKSQSKASSQKKSNTTVEHFPANNDGAANDGWGGNAGWGDNQQSDNAAGDWGNNNDQANQGDDPWAGNAGNGAGGDWGEDNNQGDQGDNAWGNSGGTGSEKNDFANKDGHVALGGGNEKRSSHGSERPRTRDRAHTTRSQRNLPPARSERAPSNAAETNPTAHIKPYWADWRGTSHEVAKDARRPREAPREVYNYPAGPKPTVPADKPMAASHGVQIGKGADYVHKTYRPVYLDQMTMPYAVFTFKYRGKGRLEKIIRRKVDSDFDKVVEEVERDQLLAMSKEKLVEEFMRMKSPTAAKAQAAGSRTGNDGGHAAPVSTDDNNNGGGWDNQSKRNRAQGNGAGWGAPSHKSQSQKSNNWDQGVGANGDRDNQSNKASKKSDNWNNNNNNNNNGSKAPTAKQWPTPSAKAPSQKAEEWENGGNTGGNTGATGGWDQGGSNKHQWGGQIIKDASKSHAKSKSVSHKKTQSAARIPTQYTNDPMFGRRPREANDTYKCGSIHGVNSSRGHPIAPQIPASKAKQSSQAAGGGWVLDPVAPATGWQPDPEPVAAWNAEPAAPAGGGGW